MSRVQLALNVSDLDDAIDFYSAFFKTPPAKVHPGYANFAIEEPPLKLVLIEGVGEPGSINHLGVEVSTTEDVLAAVKYLGESELQPDVEGQTTCCHAVQDKVWVSGPDGANWEIYTILADADPSDGLDGDEQCCTSASLDPAGISIPAASRSGR